MTTISVQETPVLPLSKISKGRNPRGYFDEAEMAELVASVKEQGILQPILVRPLNDGYQIVAGERRYRAAITVYGEEGTIPVNIKEMSDAEVDAAALVENVIRADMSPTEEAAAAAKVVGRVQGDRDEAARILGWSRSKLDKRLALMNCAPEVRKALDTRQIDLGHAELLAALPKETQDKLVPIIISEKKTVSELKTTIENAACSLSAAIFDKADCAACPHNSSLQQSMFAESITDGNCTNRKCYTDKTEAALNATVESLKDEYPVIRIVRVGDNSTLTKLQAEGPAGVGQAQAEACRGCANYGAAVSALPQAMGKVYKDQCFDPACNQQKVAARIQAEKQAAEEAKKPVQSGQPAAGGSEKSAGSASDKPKEAEKVVTSITESDRIKSYREKVWRAAMKKEIANNPAVSAVYLVALAINGNGGKISEQALGKAFKKLTGKDTNTADLGKNTKLAEALTPEQLASMTTLIAASAMDSIDVHYLKQLASHHKLDLTKHWALNAEFLELLTKSEIELIAKQVALDKAIGDGFKKLFNEKKSDLIEKLLSVKDFDYSAKIPKVLQY